MKTLFLTLVFFSVAPGRLSGSETGFDAIQLLEGLSAKPAS
jgi:hypothetical protein